MTARHLLRQGGFGPSLLGAAVALGWASPALAQTGGVAESSTSALSAPPLSAPPTNMALNRDAGALPDPMPESKEDRDKMLGVMLDVGLPDGTMASFVLRPISLLRLQAGLGYNAISPGFRVGAALLPFGAGPSVSLDYGHYFEGDANSLASTLTGTNEADSILLERVGYDFVNLRAGMELGGDSFIFFTRGGVSWVRTTIHEFADLLDPGEGVSTENTSIVVTRDPVLSAFVPSFQIGMIIRL